MVIKHSKKILNHPFPVKVSNNLQTLAYRQNATIHHPVKSVICKHFEKAIIILTFCLPGFPLVRRDWGGIPPPPLEKLGMFYKQASRGALKNVSLKVLQNFHENTCDGILIQ